MVCSSFVPVRSIQMPSPAANPATSNRKAGIARLHVRRELSFHAAVRAGHRVAGVAEVQVQPIDPAVHVLVAGDADLDGGGRLAAGDRASRAANKRDLVHIAPCR